MVISCNIDSSVTNDLSFFFVCTRLEVTLSFNELSFKKLPTLIHLIPISKNSCARRSCCYGEQNGRLLVGKQTLFYPKTANRTYNNSAFFNTFTVSKHCKTLKSLVDMFNNVNIAKTEITRELYNFQKLLESKHCM